MKLKKLDYNFSVCKVSDYSKTDLNCEYCFTAKTEEENSLVCKTVDVPDNVIEREDGWKALKINGVLADVSAVLAENNIGIFVVSTYNTDYVFIKEENYLKAQISLKNAGYDII